MNPKVTNITEQNILGANGQIAKSIILTYKVGNFGPFTLVTTQTDIQNGTAANQMQAIANSYQALPLT